MKRCKPSSAQPVAPPKLKRPNPNPDPDHEAANVIKNNQVDNINKIFGHWRNFLVNDSFTDLRVFCKDDFGCGGVTLHRAVLASASPMMARLLASDLRDETHLILPDVSKKDFATLVQVLYGEGEHRPDLNPDLLSILGILELPRPSLVEAETKHQTRK